ncbi:hypothetical protein DID80_05835 [Candidatus Marinamargulisbacteria bacterium SCGC AAA071-K20]|nr:hypothetical protein DID80_05835 [Candidatus Marinamargulisbacteria bacterium SCGC AAA071-K20]
MKNKNWIIVFTLCSSLLFFGIALINIVIDPFNIYSNDGMYVNNQRFANAGAVRTADYNSVILGGSLTENLPITQLNKMFDANFIKLAVSGSTAYESRLFAQKAFKTHEVQTVVSPIDFFAFRGSTTRLHKTYEFPEYLLDNNPFNDLSLYVNFDTFKYSLKLIINAVLNKSIGKFTTDHEDLFNWYRTDKDKFSYDHFSKAWENRGELSEEDGRSYNVNLLETSFRANFLVLIKNNPNTQFHIYFPPYSSLMYCLFIDDKPHFIKEIVAFKKMVMESTLPYKNVHLYDFQTATHITTKSENYKDLSHYSPAIDQVILKEIARPEHYKVTKKNTLKKLATFEAHLNRFNRSQMISK